MTIMYYLGNNDIALYKYVVYQFLLCISSIGTALYYFTIAMHFLFSTRKYGIEYMLLQSTWTIPIHNINMKDFHFLNYFIK